MPSFSFVSNLPASGETGRRIREIDWARTSVGPRANWPAALRVPLEIVLLSQTPSFIAWGSTHLLFYNDAYAALIGPRHPQALGRPVPEVFPEAWEELRTIFEHARACQPVLTRDRPRSAGQDGKPTGDYFTYSYVPLFKAPGIVGGVLCTCFKTEAHPGATEAGTPDEGFLKQLLQQSPAFIKVLRGPEHVFEIANDQALEMLGHRGVIGKPVRTVLPEFQDQGYLDLLDRVYRTGDTLQARQTTIRSRRPDAEDDPGQRIVDFVYQPIRGLDGGIDGIFVHGTEVTDLVRAGERRQFAIDALPHHIAVLDEAGVILTVNRAWREHAQQAGGVTAPGVEGENYLQACDRAAAAGDAISGRIATLIREVVSRQRVKAESVHRPGGEGDERWFRVAIQAVNELNARRIVVTREDVTEHRRHEERLDHLVNHDQLTGLPNRVFLQRRIAEAIEQSGGARLGLAVLSLNLDHFKRVNDFYGREGGDEALRTVAATLKGLVRASDTVARLGSDEFAVLLCDIPDTANSASALADLIKERLSSALYIDRRDVPISASIGISLYPNDGTTPADLLQRADMAMQTAKADGRRATRLYSADIGARALARARLEIDLRDALAAGEFRLVYQPQFNMRTGAVVGAEALLRWRHPTRGEVPPQAFIPLTEETGLIVEIGGWVLRTACRQAMRWRAGAPPRVAVNISAVQLKRRDFVATVVGALDEAGLDPARLDLEITEGVLLAEGDGALAQLESLRKIGISLTLDDFGTGYSNLSYLTRFPIDRLKIDRSFVHGLPDEQSPTSVVAAVIGLSRGLNLDLVAEGVETAEQASCLMAAGCDKAQGFLLSRPLPPEEMAALVAAAEEGRHGAWYGLQD